MIVSGPLLDAVLPSGKLRFPSSIATTTPESARAAVDQLKSQGSDFIKVQSVISHDAYLAAAAEAHKKNLPFVGHVPDKVRITEAVGAGQKSIEHLMGSFEGCSSEEQKFIDGQGTTKPSAHHRPIRRNAARCWRLSPNRKRGNAQRSRGSAAAHFSISATWLTTHSANMSRLTGAMSHGNVFTTR